MSTEKDFTKVKLFIIKTGSILLLIAAAYQLLLYFGDIRSKSIPKILLFNFVLFSGIGLYGLIKKPLKRINIYVLSFLFGAAYLIVSAGLYIFVSCKGKKQIYIVDKVASEYHPIRGWRYSPGKTRMISIVNRVVEFDKYCLPNNYGFSSTFDYSFKKQDSTVKRIVVLGDSFTDGSFLEKPWPSVLHEILQKNPGQKYEVYSYAYSGNGLYNWHNIFFKEIIPNYEFDEVVLAISQGDLNSKFNVQLLGERNLNANFDTIPSDKEDFEKNYKSRMMDLSMVTDLKYDLIQYHFYVAPNAQEAKDKELANWTALDEHYLAYPKPQILLRAINTIAILKSQMSQKNKPVQAMTGEAFLAKYGKHRVQLLEDILSYCAQNNKPVTLATMPMKLETFEQPDYYKNPDQLELEYLTSKYHTKYFDGYSIFYGMTREQKQDYFFAYDNHWNSEGAAFFARKFSEYIIKK